MFSVSESEPSERQLNIKTQQRPLDIDSSVLNPFGSGGQQQQHFMMSPYGLNRGIGSFGTSFRAFASFVIFTTTAYSTTTSTVSLTAICASTTGYNLCPASSG